MRELTLAQSVQYNQAVSCHYVGKYALYDCWAPICCMNEITSEQSHKSLPNIFISVINLMEDLTSRFSLQRSWFQSFKENFCLECWNFCNYYYKRIDSIWAFNTGSLVQKKNLGDLCKMLMWTKAVQTPRISFRTDFIKKTVRFSSPSPARSWFRAVGRYVWRQ